jgi:hypothetical protein
MVNTGWHEDGGHQQGEPAFPDACASCRSGGARPDRPCPGCWPRHRAGVPEPQPTDARVEWGEFNLCPTNRALDFLCLTHSNSFAVDLSGWRLDGAVKFTFEGGTVVPARGLLHVSPDVKAFRSRPPAESGRVRFVVGNYSGRLDRARPTVLKNAAGRHLVER